MNFAKTASLSLASLLIAGAALADGSVTISSWGGAYQKASRMALYDPAAKNLGIEIKEDTLSGFSDTRLQVESGKVTWDIVEQWNNDCIVNGENDKYFEALDYSVINTDGLPKDLVKKYWIVGNAYYSTVLAYNTDKYQTAPKNWTDFWDVKKFPGARGLYKYPNTTMEAALMADGVPMEKVYEVLGTEEGLERAFEKLREIKPHVAVWWGSGAQSANLIKDGEVDMLSIWSGRADAAIDAGAAANYSFEQGMRDYNCLTVVKGSPNKDMAMKVINEMLSAENQANLPKYINYGPVNQNAFKTGKISAEKAAVLPTSPKNVAMQLTYDAHFWAANAARIGELYDEFLQE